jgi:DNA-binding NarL/FixJ family response regulator
MDCAGQGDVTSTPIPILIVADHPITCIGLAAILDDATDLRVVGQTDSSSDILKQVMKTRPMVVLMDDHLSGAPVESLAGEITRQSLLARVIVISTDRDEHYINKLMQSGVSGFLLKTEIPGNIRKAVRSVGRGETWLSHGLHDRASKHLGKNFDANQVLTSREREVLRLVALGKSNEQIANMLCISKGTVRNHMTNVYNKLGIHRRVEAVLWAVQQGIIQ